MAGEVDRLKGYVHTVVMGPPLPEAMLEQRRRDGIPIMMVDEERVWCGGFFLRVSELAALEATRLEMIEALDKQEADALAEKSIASLAAEVKAGMEPAEVSSMDDVPAENSDLGELDQAEEILSPLLLETSLAAHATKRAGENIKFEGESLRVGCPVDEYVEEYSVNEYRRSVETESPPRAAGCVGGKVEEAFAVYSGGATVVDVLEGRVRLERGVDRQGIGLSGGTSVGNDVGMLGSLPEKDADNPSPNLGGSVPVGVDRGTDSMWDHVIMMFVPADALTREPSLVGDGWVSSWSERGLDVTRDKMTVGDLLESFPAVRTLPDGLSFDMAWADGLVVYPHDPDPGELRTSLRSLREEAAAHGFYGDGVGLVMLSGRTCRWLLRHDAESMRLAYTTHAGEEITAEFTSSMTVVRQNGVLTGKLARNSGQLFETFLAECRKRKEKGENFRLPWWLSGDTSVSK